MLPLVSAITCVDVEGEDPYLFLSNQACYYEHSEQKKSLIHPYQAMYHGVKFCLTPKSRLTQEGEVGKQMMTVDEQKIPLLYDGRKLFLKIRKPSKDEMKTLETFEITSPAPYDPERENDTENMPRRDSKRRYKDYPGGLSIEEWRKRLALAPDANDDSNWL